MTSFSIVKQRKQSLTDKLVEYSGGLDAEFVEKITIYTQSLFSQDSLGIRESTFMSQMANQFGMTNSYMISLILNAVVLCRRSPTTVSLEEYCKLICTFLTDDFDVKINFVFSVYDLDHNGILNKNEVNTLLKSSIPSDDDEEQAELLRDLLELVMKVVDRDGNGSIDVEEFRKLAKKDVLYIEFLGQCLPDDKMCRRFKNKLLKRTTRQVKEYFEFEQANTGVAALLPAQKKSYYPIELEFDS